MKEIKSRNEVTELIHAFYDKARKDDLLGPFFNSTFQTEKAWAIHYELLVDFWMLNLFEEKNFKGNPQQAHQGADRRMGHSMSPKHFERWADLWCGVIDNIFEGEKAQLAKSRARQLAVGMYGKVLQGRPDKGDKEGVGFSFLGKVK